MLVKIRDLAMLKYNEVCVVPSPGSSLLFPPTPVFRPVPHRQKARRNHQTPILGRKRKDGDTRPTLVGSIIPIHGENLVLGE